jgi:aryl-alcohol dehydrogenase-like predicted oxidoreductase
MEQRLGSLIRNKLKASRLGFGLAAIGRPGYITLNHGLDVEDPNLGAMERRALLLLDRAYMGGVRYFDVARSYGRAEDFLATWLSRNPGVTNEVTIGSKWGYAYTADWQINAAVHEKKELSIAQLQRQWNETRTLIGSNLDLYQIHSATLVSGVLEDKAVCEALFDLRNENGVAIGLSLTGLDQVNTLEHALGIEVAGQPLFDTVQATWNLLETSVGHDLAEAHKSGVGVIVKEALANGRLTGRGSADLPNESLETLKRAAATTNTTISKLALAAVLAQPWADVVLSGATTVDQLEDNLGATEIVVDASTLDDLESIAEPAEAYWELRSKLPWT